MQQDPGQIDGSAALTSGAAAPGQTESTIALRLALWRARFGAALPRVTFGPVAGVLALAVLIAGSLAVVVVAAAGPTLLVPHSGQSFAPWEAGPLQGLVGGLRFSSLALQLGWSGLLIAMLFAYGVAIAAVRSLSMRTIAICVLALHAILLLGPPLQLTDIFNYIGYARLGGLHGLNPYTHVIGQEQHDPIFAFTSWNNLHSPYGELFTALSYPLAWISIPAAYWTVKVATVLLSLVFVGLVWLCARQLGRDPRFAVLFVAANPIYLLYAVGGFHNDFFMLVPSTAAISLLLARRDRAAGAALMVAVAVKFTAILLLPFLLVAAVPPVRRKRVLAGAVAAAIPLLAMSLALFGFSLPNLSQQSTLLTGFSIPNLVGLLIHLGGGTPGLLRVANVAVVVTVALLLRRRGDWLARAGWATFALIASLAWLMPWYVIWVLPLAALGSSIRLRRAAAALTVFLVLTFLPASAILESDIHFSALGGSAGQASQALANKLAWYR